MCLEEQFRVARRTEHLERHRARAVLLLEFLHVAQRPLAQDTGAIGRSHHRVVERVDHIVTGIAALDLVDGVLGDLLGGNKLHLVLGGQHGELLHAEQAVLAGVDVDGLERFVGERSGIGVVGRESLTQRLRPGVDHADGLAAARHWTVLDALPGDRRRGFDLLGDRRLGRAGHQEQQHRVGARHGALRQQRPARLVLGMRVRNVQPHAAGAGSADLEVETGTAIDHAAVENLQMADQSWRVERLEQIRCRLDLDRATDDLPPELLGGAIHVLVGDGRGGVDTVDDDRRSSIGEDAVEEKVGEVLLLEQVKLRPQGLDPRHLFDQSEDVTAAGGDSAVAGFRQQRLAGLLGLLQAEAVNLDLGRLSRQQLPADRGAHQTGATQDEDLLILDDQRSISRGVPGPHGTRFDAFEAGPTGNLSLLHLTCRISAEVLGPKGFEE